MPYPGAVMRRRYNKKETKIYMHCVAYHIIFDTVVISLAPKLGVQTIDDWYSVKQEDFIEHGGTWLLALYNNSYGMYGGKRGRRR